MREAYEPQGSSGTPIFDSLCEEYERLFRSLPGDRSGEEGLQFRGFGPMPMPHLVRSPDLAWYGTSPGYGTTPGYGPSSATTYGYSTYPAHPYTPYTPYPEPAPARPDMLPALRPNPGHPLYR
jgi:hypothetical protein